jgi:multidrug efflux pump subunit AcrA (membrane-fusion protein)
MLKRIFFLLPVIFISCKPKVEKTKPTIEDISESIYASGSLKSKNQYQALSTVNGVIEHVFVKEGDSVKKGDIILTIGREVQQLNKENAELADKYADFNSNQEKLNEAKQYIELSKSKMKNDSVLYNRQKNLWQDQIGTKVELEQRELAYQNSKTDYYSAIVKYDDLKRQIDFTSSQSKRTLSISRKLESDFIIKSDINGIVYNLPKVKGEMVGLQTPLAIIGDARNFILEMQVDEYDIVKIRKGLKVQVTMDSYKGRIFEAVITRIIPLMNEKSKTFLVEAEFTVKPDILYPGISFEANIVLQSKKDALLIPRNYMLNDSVVLKSNGEKTIVKTGLKDYLKIEILSGIRADDELQKPVQ